MLDVRLLDHLIVANQTVSMAERWCDAESYSALMYVIAGYEHEQDYVASGRASGEDYRVWCVYWRSASGGGVSPAPVKPRQHT